MNKSRAAQLGAFAVLLCALFAPQSGVSGQLAISVPLSAIQGYKVQGRSETLRTVAWLEVRAGGLTLWSDDGRIAVPLNAMTEAANAQVDRIRTREAAKTSLLVPVDVVVRLRPGAKAAVELIGFTTIEGA